MEPPVCVLAQTMQKHEFIGPAGLMTLPTGCMPTAGAAVYALLPPPRYQRTKWQPTIFVSDNLAAYPVWLNRFLVARMAITVYKGMRDKSGPTAGPGTATAIVPRLSDFVWGSQCTCAGHGITGDCRSRRSFGQVHFRADVGDMPDTCNHPKRMWYNQKSGPVVYKWHKPTTGTTVYSIQPPTKDGGAQLFRLKG